MRARILKIWCYLLIAAFSGCSWRTEFAVVDANTGRPLAGVKASWIKWHQRFMDFKKDVTEKVTDQNGHVVFNEWHNTKDNAVSFELFGYSDARAGIKALSMSQIAVRVSSPYKVSYHDAPWTLTDSQVEKSKKASTADWSKHVLGNQIVTNDSIIYIKLYKLD